MHELALYTQLPASRHAQVLHILAGVTGMQPVSLCEQTLIYQQLKLPNSSATARKGAAKQQQNDQSQRSSYHKLVRELDLSSGKTGEWRMRVEDIPQPGVSKLIIRPVSENKINERILERFRGGSEWYKYATQYLSPTSRFIHSNVIIRVSRPVTVPEGTGALEPLDAPVPPIEDCMPADASGGYVVEACVRVEDGSKSKLMEQATAELLGFQKQMEGALDLRVPERLAMDTRVRAS